MRSVWRGAVLAALGFVGIAVTALPARAGIISLALSSGAPGGDAPVESNGFKFTNPSGSTNVAVDQLTTAETVKASTAGGGVFFGGSGLPVLLSLADGSAYI